MGLIHPGVLVAALSATAALAFCNLAAATCCSGGVAPYTVVLDWEVNTTNNASGPPAGSPWFGKQYFLVSDVYVIEEDGCTAACTDYRVVGVCVLTLWLSDYPQQTYSQLRLYIANNPPVQFMQLHIGCSDGSPLTDLKVRVATAGMAGDCR